MCLLQSPWRRRAKVATRGGWSHEDLAPAALCRRRLPCRHAQPGLEGSVRYKKGLDMVVSLIEHRSVTASASLPNPSHPLVDHWSHLLGTCAQVAGPHSPGRTVVCKREYVLVREGARGGEASVWEAKQIHRARPSLRSPGWDSLAWHRFGGRTQFLVSINAAEPSSSISAALWSTSGVARGQRNMLRTECYLECRVF